MQTGTENTSLRIGRTTTAILSEQLLGGHLL